MMTEIILQQSAETIALEERRAELRMLRTHLAEQEAELNQLRAQLKAFETRYMQQVGVLYAELDGLEARITEREIDLYDSDAARERAEEARQRAAASHEAAFGAEIEELLAEPSANLKALYREVAKRIHPDVARDAEEERYFHLLMARANQAYSRGHTEVLQQMLDDHLELRAAAGGGEGATAEVMRVSRQIQHVQRDLRRLDAERSVLLESEVAQLFVDAEKAMREHRDLLAELAASVQAEIAEAKGRFELVDRQIRAHGR